MTDVLLLPVPRVIDVTLSTQSRAFNGNADSAVRPAMQLVSLLNFQHAIVSLAK